jgi:putative ABC transport system substrate-binding protein
MTAAAVTLSLPGQTSSHTTTARVPRIGFLIGSGFPTLVAAFRDELRKLGYAEGDNLILEMRLSRPNTNDTEAQVAELVAMDMDLIVAAALPQALAIRRLNTRVPVVVGTGPGLVGNGLADSVEKPGRRTTGMDELPAGLTARRMTLLMTGVPKISRVALLSTTPGRGGHELQVADAERAANTLGISTRSYRASNLTQIEAALTAIAADRMDGLLSFQGGLSLVNRQLIVDFAATHRLPAMYQSRHFVEAGGLMALAPDQDEQFRVAARYADKILKGADAGDLPIQHPGRYFLTVNAATAATFNLAADFLATADAVVR